MKYNKLEYNSALYLSSISLFLGIGISKIINSIGSNSWISIILGTAIGLLINYIFTKLPEKNNKIFVYIYSTILLTLNLFLITKRISYIDLKRTPYIIVIIPLIIIIYYISNKRIKISFIYTLIYLIPLTALAPKINIDEFIPLLTSNIYDIIKCSLTYAFISTTPFILFPKFKENYNYKSYLLSSILVLIIFVIIIGNLGTNLAKLYRYPEYMVFKEISLLGFIENIQNILSYLWLFCSFILSSMATYNIKRVSNNKILIITLLLMTFILNNVLLKNYIYFEYITKYYGIILFSILILFLISKIFSIYK